MWNGPTDLMLALCPLGLLVWLAYDVYVAFVRPGRSPTLTRRVQALSRDYPAIPALSGLILGLLIGHFWGAF